ncbi:hypothetical protein MIR68_007091 [Amoeboaphelidium protococcarum]|nr:hypothetical protein MIR68_007091 [Amoeboaphelidium protococcarum]
MTNTTMRVLIIDNYDSYTFNLYQLFAPFCDVIVIRNDAFIWNELREYVDYFHAIVISPGPGTPSNDEDIKVCKNVLLECPNVPILGICLGLQALVYVHGGKVIKAPRMMHGLSSEIQHDCSHLYDGISQKFKVIRYHSLIVSSDLPEDLKKTCWTFDEVDGQVMETIMGVQHTQYPHYSVQFHPESICSQFGSELIQNFLEIAHRHWGNQVDASSKMFTELPRSINNANLLNYTFTKVPYEQKLCHPAAKVIVKKLQLQNAYNCSDLYNCLYAQEKYSVWLDSARKQSELSRFSFMACLDDSPHARIYSYYQQRQLVISLDHSGTGTASSLSKSNESCWQYLASVLRPYQSCLSVVTHTDGSLVSLPFDFSLGLIGYFGYEMLRESEMFCIDQHHAGSDLLPDIPDAQFLFAGNALVHDQLTNQVYLLHLTQDDDSNAYVWFTQMESKVLSISKLDNPPVDLRQCQVSTTQLDFDRDQYVKAVEKCQDHIKDGNSYELCLTTKIQMQVDHCKCDDPLNELYMDLRNRNSAPYGSLLKMPSYNLHGEYQKDDTIFLCSSSPERFIKISPSGQVSMKPIKGTVSRGDTPEEDERQKQKLKMSVKDYAENLMIVDLIRNDLNQFCDPSTVKVPKLMVVESYETVHQLVTEVHGQCNGWGFGKLSALDALKFTFPPGSMTGAPKKRTVELVQRIEADLYGCGGRREIYSGIHGYISLNGAADFSVIIRSVFGKHSSCSDRSSGSTMQFNIGAGGAITALSDPQEEFDEMILKAQSVLPSILSVFPTAAQLTAAAALQNEKRL